MDIRDGLIKARALIEKGWAQGAFAKDKYGETVGTTDPTACQWCATGALMAIVGKEARYSYCVKLLEEILQQSIIIFNDSRCRTKEEVLALYDKAIAEYQDV